MSEVPKILHRIYFDSFPPFKDPFKRYLETWKRELPEYKIMLWNADTFEFPDIEFLNRSLEAKDPVFLSEYIRWKVLDQYGGIYLDADCEILNGKKIEELRKQLESSDEYDAFLGIEEYSNGYPTAQTVAAKKGRSDLVKFMLRIYEGPLSSPLWFWRNERLLIGPQLISLYFRDRGHTKNNGFFVGLEKPEIVERVKIYTQDYFSPKFSTLGKELNVTENTCVYHLFSNLNVNLVSEEAKRHREDPLLFNEYIDYLQSYEVQKRLRKSHRGKVRRYFSNLLRAIKGKSYK